MAALLSILFYCTLGRIYNLLVDGPGLYIGGKEDPYLLRWYILPRNPFFNIYLHKIVRNDDDRALHDHPWWSLSLLFRGILYEVDNDHPQSFEYNYHGPRKLYAPAVRLRPPYYAHRLELGHTLRLFEGTKGLKAVPMPAWTLFITGPKLREWGFHCPQGWKHWSLFTDTEGNAIGPGCDDSFREFTLTTPLHPEKKQIEMMNSLPPIAGPIAVIPSVAKVKHIDKGIAHPNGWGYRFVSDVRERP